MTNEFVCLVLIADNEISYRNSLGGGGYTFIQICFINFKICLFKRICIMKLAKRVAY